MGMTKTEAERLCSKLQEGGHEAILGYVPMLDQIDCEYIISKNYGSFIVNIRIGLSWPKLPQVCTSLEYQLFILCHNGEGEDEYEEYFAAYHDLLEYLYQVQEYGADFFRKRNSVEPYKNASGGS